MLASLAALRRTDGSKDSLVAIIIGILRMAQVARLGGAQVAGGFKFGSVTLVPFRGKHFENWEGSLVIPFVGITRIRFYGSATLPRRPLSLSGLPKEAKQRLAPLNVHKLEPMPGKGKNKNRSVVGRGALQNRSELKHCGSAGFRPEHARLPAYPLSHGATAGPIRNAIL